MNYLAHIYLSGDDDDIMLGNFMADGIKGRRHEDYSPKIQQGILLHRFIDDFTDFHPIVLETKILFRPKYSKLAPILVDILYDHYLAKNWQQYHTTPLDQFVCETYKTLQARWDELTPRIQFMLPHMIENNWLYNYQFKEGIERVMFGMSRRVRYGDVLKDGWDDLQPVYEQVGEQFSRFFIQLRSEVSAWIKQYETKNAGQ